MIVLAMAVGGFAFYRYVAGTYHLATVDDGKLYRDGARSLTELKHAIARTQVHSVVCLVDDAEESDPKKPQFAAEAEYVVNHGLRYHRIPVKLGGWPTTDDIRGFLNVATDPNAQPVLVHCAQGVRRTGMFVAAYQESVMGYDKQKAKDAIKSFGHTDKTVDDIKKFIDHYDPVERAVKGLP